jgi:hypothetical protein
MVGPLPAPLVLPVPEEPPGFPVLPVPGAPLLPKGSPPVLVPAPAPPRPPLSAS